MKRLVFNWSLTAQSLMNMSVWKQHFNQRLPQLIWPLQHGVYVCSVHTNHIRSRCLTRRKHHLSFQLFLGPSESKSSFFCFSIFEAFLELFFLSLSLSLQWCRLFKGRRCREFYSDLQSRDWWSLLRLRSLRMEGIFFVSQVSSLNIGSGRLLLWK